MGSRRSTAMPCVSCITLLVLFTSLSASVSAQADTAAAGSCGTVEMAVGSFSGVSWIDPPVTGEGVYLMNLTVCGTAEAPEVTLTTTSVIPVTDTGENPGYCDQLNATTLVCVTDAGMGSVSILDLTNTTDPKLLPVNSSGPVHVEVLSNGKVATAQFNGGSFTILDPALDAATAVIETIIVPEANATGDGVQGAPHPHMALEVADGELLVPDLGTDEVYQYGVAADGSLTWQGSSSTPAGSGPRHVAVGPMGVVYVAAEISLEIIELGPNCTEGAVGAARGVCAATAIPPPAEAEYLSAAAIRVSKDQGYVYVSMRRPEELEVPGTIVTYKLETNGSVGELVNVTSSGGFQPRDFALIDVPGFKEFVVVANRKSNSVDVLDRDPVTGAVGEELATIEVSTPVSILALSDGSEAEASAPVAAANATAGAGNATATPPASSPTGGAGNDTQTADVDSPGTGSEDAAPTLPSDDVAPEVPSSSRLASQPLLATLFVVFVSVVASVCADM